MLTSLPRVFSPHPTSPLRYLVLSALLAAAGCASHPSAGPANTDPDSAPSKELNQGYSLLYKLMSDESNVDKLLIIKSTSEPTKQIIKEISDAAGEAKKKLDFFISQDNRLNYKMADLPAIEQRARDLQAKASQSTLLHSSGKELELNLLFTQAQAMNYAEQLCKALDEKEQAGNRKRFLASLAEQCAGLSDKVMKMLTVQGK